MAAQSSPVASELPLADAPNVAWSTPREPDPSRMTVGAYVLRYMGERTGRAVYGDGFIDAALAEAEARS